VGPPFAATSANMPGSSSPYAPLPFRPSSSSPGEGPFSRPSSRGVLLSVSPFLLRPPASSLRVPALAPSPRHLGSRSPLGLLSYPFVIVLLPGSSYIPLSPLSSPDPAPPPCPGRFRSSPSQFPLSRLYSRFPFPYSPIPRFILRAPALPRPSSFPALLPPPPSQLLSSPAVQPPWF